MGTNMFARAKLDGEDSNTGSDLGTIQHRIDDASVEYLKANTDESTRGSYLCEMIRDGHTNEAHYKKILDAGVPDNVVQNLVYEPGADPNVVKFVAGYHSLSRHIENNKKALVVTGLLSVGGSVALGILTAGVGLAALPFVLFAVDGLVHVGLHRQRNQLVLPQPPSFGDL